MAFIANKTRESLIKRINKSYKFRKFLISIEIILLIGFIVMAFLSTYYQRQNPDTKTWSWFNSDTKKLTDMGWLMLAWAAVIAILGIIALILTWTLKSPSDVKKDINKLESSALSGKRIKRNETVSEIYKSRTESKKKKEK